MGERKKKKDARFQGGRFHGDIWFQKNVEQRTIKALEEKERLFLENHSDDTDEQLLDYLRSCAQGKKRTPYKCEVPGSDFIAKRFHGWDAAAQAAGLPPAGIPPKGARKKAFRKEYLHQAALFKTVGKEERVKALSEKRAASEAERRQREERDRLWGLEHARDTDEQLIAYLRSCADTLGHPPLLREVLGGYYISERFGGWKVALLCAGLHVPYGVGKVTGHHIKAYEAWLCIHKPVIVPSREELK